jgi:protein-S-isoprenylcysteine O-methyltransferase Ste14
MKNPTHGVRRAGYLVYGGFAYVVFLLTFLYAIGFVGNFWHTFGWQSEWLRSMDFGGPRASLAEALVVDGLLLGVFAVQHSVMARVGFKKWWTRVVPKPIERSTYVLAASLCLLLLYWQWRPIGTTLLWDLSGTSAAPLLISVSLLGWTTVLLATFMLDHFELFGVSQVWHAYRGLDAPTLRFSTPALYKVVRHPIYLGFMVAFWATPAMTLGHLVFAGMTTAYILMAIQLEERDLVRLYGEAYREYRQRVRMLLPVPRRHPADLPDGSVKPAE